MFPGGVTIDIFSHAFLGFVIGHSLQLDKKKRTILIISCIIPDIDSVSIIFGWETLFQFHRGPLHSFLFAVLGSLAIGMVYTGWLRVRKSSFSAREFLFIVFICLGGILSHLFLDLCTPWTTQVLWPFSREGITFDLTSFFDPLFLVVLFLTSAFIIYTKKGKIVQVAAVAALLVVGANFGVRYYEKGEALLAVEEMYSGNMNMMVMPTYRPDRWWVVVTVLLENGYTYEIHNADSVHHKIVSSRTLEPFPMYTGLAEPPIESPEEAAAYSKKDKKVSAFIEKYRLPAFTVTCEDSVWHVVWYDVSTGLSGRISHGIVVTVAPDGTLTVTFSVLEFDA